MTDPKLPAADDGPSGIDAEIADEALTAEPLDGAAELPGDVRDGTAGEDD